MFMKNKKMNIEDIKQINELNLYKYYTKVRVFKIFLGLILFVFNLFCFLKFSQSIFMLDNVTMKFHYDKFQIIVVCSYLFTIIAVFLLLIDNILIFDEDNFIIICIFPILSFIFILLLCLIIFINYINNNYILNKFDISFFYFILNYFLFIATKFRMLPIYYFFLKKLNLDKKSYLIFSILNVESNQHNKEDLILNSFFSKKYLEIILYKYYKINITGENRNTFLEILNNVINSKNKEIKSLFFCYINDDFEKNNKFNLEKIINFYNNKIKCKVLYEQKITKLYSEYNELKKENIFNESKNKKINKLNIEDKNELDDLLYNIDILNSNFLEEIEFKIIGLIEFKRKLM